MDGSTVLVLMSLLYYLCTPQTPRCTPHELDDLLHILFLSYRQYAELASNLRQTAIALGKENYMQAAEALLRAVQAYYITDYITVEPIGESLPQVALTDITNIKAANHEITLPD